MNENFNMVNRYLVSAIGDKVAYKVEKDETLDSYIGRVLLNINTNNMIYNDTLSRDFDHDYNIYSYDGDSPESTNPGILRAIAHII